MSSPPPENSGAVAGSGVLAQIVATQSVTDGVTTYPLHSHVGADDEAFITRVIREVRPESSLEVGMAYGISTLVMCAEFERLGLPTRHVVIDPFQSTDWHGIGLRNIRVAGYERFVEFHEERSEYILPRFAQEGRRLDLALIDGWHSFDHALVEFFYISRMLRVGGMVLFDDANWPSISKLLRFLVTLPGYEVFAAKERSLGSSWLGKVRQRVGDSPVGRQLLHPSFRHRSWELGIFQRCVALRKISEDTRDMKWFEDF